MVPRLGQGFFVINNLDQSSGFVNLSFSGDPEKFVDCGSVVSNVHDAEGDRSYTIVGARARQSYQQVGTNRVLYQVERSVALEGRANIIIEELSQSSSKATVNARYVLTRTLQATASGSRVPQIAKEEVSFSTSDSGSFQGNGQFAMTCRSNGALEKQLLTIVSP
jgi:hypothetical protein